MVLNLGSLRVLTGEKNKGYKMFVYIHSRLSAILTISIVEPEIIEKASDIFLSA